MFKIQLPLKKYNSTSGYGVLLVTVTLTMMAIVLLLLQMTVGLSPITLMQSKSRNNTFARATSTSGLLRTRDQIQTVLNAGTTVNVGYSWSNNVSTPDDPNNLGGSATQIGTFTATVLKKSGNYYLVSVTSNVSGMTDTQARLFEIAPLFSCSVDGAAVEASIMAGNIASVSDANLISYAQKGCMIKKPTPPSALSITPGTGSACSSTINQAGSSAINIGNLNAGCTYNANGTFTSLRLGNMSSTTRLNTNTSAVRTIELDTMQGVYNVNRSILLVNSANTADITVKANAINSGMSASDQNNYKGLNQLWTAGGNDTVYVAGNVNDTTIMTFAGNDTIILPGLVNIIGGGCNNFNSSDPVSNGSSGIFVGDGNDKIYINELRGAWCSAIDGQDGNDEIYFDNANTSTTDTDITGGNGNDTISCAGWMNSGCGNAVDLEVWGGNGNDIISIDTVLTLPTGMEPHVSANGSAGINIVYIKGFADSGGNSNPYITIKGSEDGTGKSLVIVGGNCTGGGSNSVITSTGPNNVLLIKTGSSITGTTTSGFARTLYY